MSGTNPFRHLPPAPKTKTVRIVSPHSSASDSDNAIPYGSFVPPRSFANAPLLESEPAGSSREGSPIDPFSMESDEAEATTEDEDLRKNTIGNAGSRSTSNTAPKMPLKPFQKTLANLASGANTVDTGGRGGNGIGNAAAGAMKPHYDVDEFKRLLLTGEKSVADASALSTPSIHSQGTQNVGDSSSNTDASSISRHSIFEPLSGINQDTPRTSHEVSPSGEEGQLSVQKSSHRSKRIRPPAPTPRHGNPMTGNVPQTVSFQDPGLSLQPSSNSNIAFPGWPTPNSPRTPTDLNKPLPLPPTADSLADGAQEPASSARRRPQSEYFELRGLQTNNSPLKHDPPAPPLARRHSQLRPKSFLGPPARSMRISEENLVDLKPQPQWSSPMSTKPPPPPPRRSGLTRSLSTASTSSSVSALRAPSATSATDDENTKSPKSPPPLPPTRTPSISSVKRPPRQSPNTNSPPATAPPPPPRRRDSSHSSTTQTRSSVEYLTRQFRSGSGASSVASVAATPLEPTTADKDVLADLTALQREVDELRGKLK